MPAKSARSDSVLRWVVLVKKLEQGNLWRTHPKLWQLLVWLVRQRKVQGVSKIVGALQARHDLVLWWRQTPLLLFWKALVREGVWFSWGLESIYSADREHADFHLRSIGEPTTNNLYPFSFSVLVLHKRSKAHPTNQHPVILAQTRHCERSALKQ